MNLKKKHRYQILDASGKVLAEYKSISTAKTMERTFRLNRHDRLEIRKK